jgi:hypothetical protein
MSISGINSYIMNALYGQDSGNSTASDPLLEVKSKKGTDVFSVLGTGNSSSLLDDSVDFSQTADFFSKLQKLEKTDPDKFKEVAAKLGKRLQGARMNGGYFLSDISRQVAEGEDISKVILQKTTNTGSYPKQGTIAEQAKALLAEALGSMGTDD